ncbi:MAG: LysR family transcriptional regulator [Candidatus Sulfotelmatobacter sp.]
MYFDVETRLLRAVITLAEELSFTRAAHKLNISQPALTKQIIEIERQHRVHLFTRRNKKRVEPTDVGLIFVEESRGALLHIDRAVQFACATRDGSGRILTMGHSPEADLGWISSILAIRLPLYPKLRIQLISEFSSELVRSVMAGDLDLALVTAPPENSRITAAAFARTHLYVALAENHPAAQKENIGLQDLAGDEWILLARRAHPLVHDAIIDAAKRDGIALGQTHEVHTAQQAFHLVRERVGVAILTKCAVDVSVRGVVVKSLSDTSLRFETCVIIRADNDSRLTNEFARSFLRRHQPRILQSKQMELSLSA